MSELRRGIIRGFDAVTYLATVEVEASRQSYAENVPVSRGIGAAEVVVGRLCAVCVFNPDDVGDAIVVAVVA